MNWRYIKTFHVYVTRIIFGVTGIFLIVLGFITGYESFWLAVKGESTSGKIVSSIVVPPDTSIRLFKTRPSLAYQAFPVVEFETKDGRVVYFRSPTNFVPPITAEETLVTVLYDPANPEKGTINSFPQLWKIPFLALLFGVVLTYLAFHSNYRLGAQIIDYT